MSTYPLTLTPLGNTLEEFECWNDTVLGVTRLALSTIARKPKIAWYHYRILEQLGILAQCKQELVDLFHTEKAVWALEQATPEQLHGLADKMVNSQEKTVELLKNLRSLPLGFWKPLYTPKLAKIEALNKQVACHIRVFSDADSSPILLTKKDQEHLIAALASPPRPSEEVRRAFSRK